MRLQVRGDTVLQGKSGTQRRERAQEPITGEEDSREEDARSDTRKGEAEAKANLNARGG